MLTTVTAITGAVVAAIAAVAGAVQAEMVRRQNRHSAQVAQASLYQNIAGRFIDLDVFFVDRPHLRPFFFSNRDCPHQGDRLGEVESAAEMIWDLAEYCHANEPVLRDLAHDWDKYFAKLYGLSPALRRYDRESGHLYPAAIRSAFRGTSQA